LRGTLAAARGWAAQRACRPQGERKVRRKMLRLACFSDSTVFPRRCRAGEETRPQRAEYDSTCPAGARAAARMRRFSLTMKMPFPSRKRGTERPLQNRAILWFTCFVEAARFWGGQPFAPFRTRRIPYRLAHQHDSRLNWDEVFSARSCVSRRLLRLPHESRRSSAPGGDDRCDGKCRRLLWKPL